jgi:protein XagA
MPSIKKALVLFFLFTSNCVFAGAWPQPKGGYFLKLSEWWIVSDQHFNDEGIVSPNTQEFGYYATSLYAEYGFTPRITGIFQFPFINYTYVVPPSTIGKVSAWSTGDVELSIKYALTYEKSVAVSMRLLLGIPLGKERGKLSGGLQTGDGEWNQGILLDAGTGFKISKSEGWLNLFGGYNQRTNGYSDEILYGAESGIKLSNNKVMIIARLMGVESTGNSTVAINPQSLFSNNREYLSFSPEAIYHFNETWGISAGVGTALSGRNIFANTTFTLGIFKRKKEYSD